MTDLQVAALVASDERRSRPAVPPALRPVSRRALPAPAARPAEPPEPVEPGPGPAAAHCRFALRYLD
ncbi:hypothetical protein ACFW1A_14655 [Kitasatospora sp. NPDC058965]|uniref:hypothetical protein n=1 Tax=Kitasatospora sp. NPDC058965 TaxID=3346682 RepID=UPI0036AC202A